MLPQLMTCVLAVQYNIAYIFCVQIRTMHLSSDSLLYIAVGCLVLHGTTIVAIVIVSITRVCTNLDTVKVKLVTICHTDQNVQNLMHRCFVLKHTLS